MELGARKKKNTRNTNKLEHNTILSVVKLALKGFWITI